MNTAASPTGEQNQSSSSPTSKRGKRRKDRTRTEKENHGRSGRKSSEPEVVNCIFAGNKYSGILRQDRLGCRFFEGRSQYTWENGVHYEGPFKDSKIQGHGFFTWPDGSTYDGALEKGLRHGEGVYLAPDGVTKYEGQWVQGHRHGEGRLSYDTAGESYYIGQWENGWKHGHGRQVWPSGNIFEGQWRYGRMSGKGSMSWFEMGVEEQYCGEWEDDHPQGVGTHTWLAPEPKPDQTVKDGPSQQMNNRYQGQWDHGVRHGNGTFYYANGAKYTGDWDRNIKNGAGQYTFEDGKVYSGPFKNDQMTEYTAPDSLNRAALNIGAEDNPVRQCINVTDLEHFALPPDVGGPDRNEGSGYDESWEVMREVHNTLLRYLGELKQVYYQYRTILRRQGEDPFVLSMHQLWTLARDFDLLTPSCTLTRLSRAIRSGPRHHQEVASEDIDDLRPLTPRQKEEHHHVKHRDSVKPPAEGQQGPLNGLTDGRESLASHRNSTLPQDAESSSVSSGTSSPRSPLSPESGPVSEAALEELEPDKPHLSRGESKASIFMGQSIGNALLLSNLHTPLYTKFWRREDAKDLVDVHGPWGILMFRHFLESFVRLAIARYPHEKGLEHQTRRLFKETLLPNFGKKATSDWVFAYLLDQDLERVMAEFQAPLWTLFKENAVGEGAYGAPQWVTQTDESTEPVRSPESAKRKSRPADEQGKGGSPKNSRSSSLHKEGAGPKEGDSPKSPRKAGASSKESANPEELATPKEAAAPKEGEMPKEGAMPEEGETPNEGTSPQEGASRQSARSEQAEAEQVPGKTSRVRRRGFGGQHRRLHLKARLDVTIRVKDVLNLMQGAGLLRPPKSTDPLPPYDMDMHSPVFATVSRDSMGRSQSTDLDGLNNALVTTGMPRGDGLDVTAQPEASAPGTAEGASRTVPPLSSEDTLTSQKAGNFQSSGGKADVTGQASTGNSKSLGAAATADMRESIAASSLQRGTLSPAEASALSSVEQTFDRQFSEGTRRASTRTTGDEAELELEDVAPLPEAQPSDVLACDFTLTVLEALRFAAEVLSPQSLTKLRWAASGEESPRDEYVALLDYVETELTYPEFVRFLFRLVESKTQQLEPSLAGQLPLHRRFEGFLRHVFMPSLEEPYTPPEASITDDAAADGSGSGEIAAEKPSVESAEGSGEVDAEKTAEEQAEAEKIPRPPFEFWDGFDDLLLEAEERYAPRMWPERFEDEVSAW